MIKIILYYFNIIDFLFFLSFDLLYLFFIKQIFYI